MNRKWTSKFELKPGRWVFVPTAEAVVMGRKIKVSIEKCWKPPSYYFHLKAGGHVEALRSHLGRDYFLHIDIQDFFGSINRTRVTRCLKDKFGYDLARSYAHESTVPAPAIERRTIIPFGFVQSQILASLCLAESALGACLDKLSQNPNVSLTVYVDDIVISASDAIFLSQALKDIYEASEKSKFILNSSKQEGPATEVTAFNIVLAKETMKVSAKRYLQFESVLAKAESKYQRVGIISYVASVNQAQGLAISEKSILTGTPKV